MLKFELGPQTNVLFVGCGYSCCVSWRTLFAWSNSTSSKNLFEFLFFHKKKNSTKNELSKFSNVKDASLRLTARARQFSSFILLVGKISAADTFEATHATIVQVILYCFVCLLLLLLFQKNISHIWFFKLRTKMMFLFLFCLRRFLQPKRFAMQSNRFRLNNNALQRRFERCNSNRRSLHCASLKSNLNLNVCWIFHQMDW